MTPKSIRGMTPAEYQREWHKNNRERARKYAKKWRSQNIDRCREMQRRWSRRALRRSRGLPDDAVLSRGGVRRFTPEQQAEKNRTQALAAYHETGAARRRGLGLAAMYRRAVVKSEKLKADRLQELQHAAVMVARRYSRSIRAKLVRRLRRYFEKAVATGSKSQRARELLGCTIDELRRHLESQFRPGMTWENHSFHGWHIDHKIPLAQFDLADPEQQKKAFHFSNLQPLWANENLTKRDCVNPAT